MPYNANKAASLNSVKCLARVIKTITDNIQSEIDALNELAEALMGVTSSVIDNIERED